MALGMGIFFDQDWFEARLKAVGADRPTLARAAGMTLDELDLVFRDMRELGSFETAAFADVLMTSVQDVAERAGASDAVLAAAPRSDTNGDEGGAPGLMATREMIAGLHERIDRLESLLERVLSLAEAARSGDQTWR
jgi:hypothetical protein